MRNAQLDKEAGELRAESDTLVRTLEEAKHAAVQGAEVRPRGGESEVQGGWVQWKWGEAVGALRALEEAKHAAVQGAEVWAGVQQVGG